MTKGRGATQEDLADYVRRVMAEKGLSGRDIERATKGQIKQAYVSQIVTRVVTAPGIDKLKALSEGLGESFWDVVAVAAGEKIESLPNYREHRLRAILFGIEELDAEMQEEIDMGLKFMEKAVDAYRKQKQK